MQFSIIGALCAIILWQVLFEFISNAAPDEKRRLVASYGQWLRYALDTKIIVTWGRNDSGNDFTTTRHWMQIVRV